MIRTNDMGYVKSIFGHPAIYPHISDDFSPPVEQWQPIDDAQVIYLKDEEDCCCFMFHPHNAVMWEVHSAVLPEHRDKSLMFTSSCVAWLKSNTKCRCLLTLIPKGNFAAMRLAEATGMKPAGTIGKSYQKGGKLLAQTMMVLEM